jgi:hypothetical protein
MGRGWFFSCLPAPALSLGALKASGENVRTEAAWYDCVRTVSGPVVGLKLCGLLVDH